MNCTEFERLLNESVLERRPADVSQLRRHAEDCLDCRPQWEHYVLLETAIPCWNAEIPEVDLADMVLARLAFEQRAPHSLADSPLADPLPAGNARSALSQRPAARDPHRVIVHVGPAQPQSPKRPHAQTFLVLAIAAAAMVLLAWPLAFRASNQQAAIKPAPAAESAAVVEHERPAANPLAAGEDESATELDSLLRDAGSAYLVLAHNAAEAFADAGLLMPRTAPGSLDDTGKNGPAPPTSNWLEGIQKELQPLGHDLKKAFDFLRGPAGSESAPAT